MIFTKKYLKVFVKLDNSSDSCPAAKSSINNLKYAKLFHSPVNLSTKPKVNELRFTYI